MDKESLRKRFKSIPVTKSKSDKIVEKLLKEKHFIEAKRVLLYYPLKDEVDIKPLYSCNKEVYLPSIVCDELVFKRYTGELKAGRYNIKEATGDIITSLDSAIIIVPALAFDRENYRLGRGKGYYDRFLKKNKIYSIGVVLKTNIVDSIEREEHDAKMEKVISD